MNRDVVVTLTIRADVDVTLSQLLDAAVGGLETSHGDKILFVDVRAGEIQ